MIDSPTVVFLDSIFCYIAPIGQDTAEPNQGVETAFFSVTEICKEGHAMLNELCECFTNVVSYAW